VLLRDTCPACGRVPRVRTGPAGLNPPGSCPSPVARGKCCGADLREIGTQILVPGSPLLAAQHWTDSLLSQAAQEPDGDRAARALGDLGIVASWVLRTAPATLFFEHGEQALAAWRQWREQPPVIRDPPRRSPPASAALTAALAATAMTILNGDDALAIEQIRALMPLTGPQQARPAGLPSEHWKQLTGPARGRFLRARDRDLAPTERLRYRSGTPMARIPGEDASALAARAQMIPQLRGRTGRSGSRLPKDCYPVRCAAPLPRACCCRDTLAAPPARPSPDCTLTAAPSRSGRRCEL